MGTENYPRTITTAYYLLCGYKKTTPQRQVHAPPASVVSVQYYDTENNKIVPGRYGRSFPAVPCYICQEKGHYVVNCPSLASKNRAGLQSLQVGLTMTQTIKYTPTANIINPN